MRDKVFKINKYKSIFLLYLHITQAEEAFSGCHRLKRLDLSGNRLSTAGLGPALSRLHSLDSVNISGNVLDELHWGHFPDELVKLVANNNRVRRLVGRPGPDRVLRRLEV